MNVEKKTSPLVTALLCFASAAYVAGAPIVSLSLESWAPMLIGLVIFLALVLIIIGVGTLAEGREDKHAREQEARIVAPATDREIATALNQWEAKHQS